MQIFGAGREMALHEHVAGLLNRSVSTFTEPRSYIGNK